MTKRSHKAMTEAELRRIRPSGMFILGDQDWGSTVEELSAEQVAQAQFRLRGELQTLPRGRCLNPRFPSARDACRVARAFSAQELKRMIFSPDRSFVVGPHGGPDPADEEAQALIEDGAADA